MKRLLLGISLAIFLIGTQSACGSKCKKCHAEVMGVKSPEKELCGDQLKQAQQSGTMICE